MRSSGLDGAFAHVLSVDAVGVYKPSPRVYELAPRRSGWRRARSSSCRRTGGTWRARPPSASATCWCNRANAPAEELDATPDYEVDRLDAIADKLGI